MSEPANKAWLDPDCIWQPDLNVAAITALLYADKDDPRKEWGGALYQNERGEYCYSKPVRGGLEGFTFTSDPTAGRLAAIYHTHPGLAKPSTHDIETADALALPSFIRSRKGDVSVYKTGASKRGVELGRALVDSIKKDPT